MKIGLTSFIAVPHAFWIIKTACEFVCVWCMWEVKQSKVCIYSAWLKCWLSCTVYQSETFNRVSCRIAPNIVQIMT